MDTLQELQAIQDATEILTQLEGSLSSGATSIFGFVYHAKQHLSERADKILRVPKEAVSK